MSIVTKAKRNASPRSTGVPPARTYPVGAPIAPLPAASQARADRRRAARRDEQAVSSWLRELSARPR